MQHRVTFVAHSHFLDVQTCLDVAEKSRNTHKSNDEWWVSTLTADAFIREVRTAQGDAAANEEIRQREIAKVRQQ